VDQVVVLPQPKQAAQETLRQLLHLRAAMAVTEGVCSPLEAPITAQAVVVEHLLLVPQELTQRAATAVLVLRRLFLDHRQLMPVVAAAEPMTAALAERVVLAVEPMLELQPEEMEQMQPLTRAVAAVVLHQMRQPHLQAVLAVPASSFSSTPYPYSQS
jgi:hypothetical protein